MFYVACYVRWGFVLFSFGLVWFGMGCCVWEVKTYVHVKAGIVAGVRIGNDHLFQSGGSIFGPVLEARMVGCRLGGGGKA